MTLQPVVTRDDPIDSATPRDVVQGRSAWALEVRDIAAAPRAMRMCVGASLTRCACACAGKGGFGYSEGPPDSVTEMGTFVHACEGDLVVKSTNEKVPSHPNP